MRLLLIAEVEARDRDAEHPSKALRILQEGRKLDRCDCVVIVRIRKRDQGAEIAKGVSRENTVAEMRRGEHCCMKLALVIFWR